MLGRDDDERPAPEPRRRAAGSGRPLRRQDADRQRGPGRRPTWSRSRSVATTRATWTCSSPAGLGNCNTRAFERSRAAIIARTKPRLEKVYRAIAAKAPHARILVLGYPHPFPAAKARQACPALSPFQGEQDMLRRLGARLNGTIASAVATVARSGARITFVPVAGRFEGHEVCGGKGRVDQRDRHELDRVRAESGLVPPDARWSARRVWGRDQRRAPALTRLPAVEQLARLGLDVRDDRRGGPDGVEQADRLSGIDVRDVVVLGRARLDESSRGSVPAPTRPRARSSGRRTRCESRAPGTRPASPCPGAGRRRSCRASPSRRCARCARAQRRCCVPPRPEETGCRPRRRPLRLRERPRARGRSRSRPRQRPAGR